MENKVCLVTGGSGGIGAKVVKKFYDKGYHVVMLDMFEENMIKVIEENGYDKERVSHYVLNVTDEEQIKATVAQIKEDLGRVDALVNTAGTVGKYAKIVDYSLENFKKIYNVNVFGTFAMIQNVLPIMMEQKSGAIVNFGSVSGMRGYSYEVGYGSSKWAVIGMTQTVANEYGEYGIRCNSVSPGWVDTGMLHFSIESYKALGDSGEITTGPLYNRPAKPEEIADAVYFLCSEEAHFITGANLLVDGGMLLG